MHRLKIFSFDVIYLFCIVSFVFIPLTLNGKDLQFQFSLILFEKLVYIIQQQFFPNAISNIDFSSDTVALNILLLILFLSSIVLISVLHLFKIKLTILRKLFFNISPYYIGLILLKYGLDKIALQQFSSPEANILYTPFGYLEKDILFWSTVGTSKFYNIALGTIEIIASAFLFFRKTRLLGFCFAIGIVLNILIINLGFDISVKTLSAFLLVVILFNLYPFIKPLYSLFIQNKLVQLGYNTNKLPLLYHNVIKICVLVLIIGFVSYPYLMGIFKNDEYSMPIFNNAYKVEGDSKNYKRIFFHKNNYIIFQTDKDEMIDYHYELDTLKKRLILQDYQRHQFEVTYEIGTTGKIKLLMNKNLILNLMPIVWQNLPALKDGLHYTIDEIK